VPARPVTVRPPATLENQKSKPKVKVKIAGEPGTP
jgi:hypothetical protein